MRRAVAIVAAALGLVAMPAGALAAADDFAMTAPDPGPCTAPCVKQDVVYEKTTSALNKAAGKQSLKLDLFRSSKTPKHNAPVVVLLHGGGFVDGDKTQMRPVAEVLAKAGFLVASVQYRLVDKNRSPSGSFIASEKDLIPASAEAEQDAEHALGWIRDHAKSLGAAKAQGRYFVGGYSAGAIAALRVGIRGGDKATPAARRFKVGGAFSISGSECGPWTKASGCTGRYNRSDPPILLFHGESDTIMAFDFGQKTCQAAILQGGGCTGYFYPKQTHFWENGTIFGGAKNLAKSHPAVVPTVAKWIRARLK